MKKLIIAFAMLLCATTAATAQSTSVEIRNNTGCPVYFRLYGDFSPNCNVTFTSALLFIPAGGTPMVIPNTGAAPLGWTLGPNQNFVGGVWIPQNPACGSSTIPTFDVGEPCSGFSATNGSYYVYNDTPQCNICRTQTVNVSWTPGNPAIMDIY